MKKYYYYFLMGLFLINLFFYFFNPEVDLSRNRINSISTSSKRILKELKNEEIEILFFSAISDDESSYVLSKIQTIFKQFKKYNPRMKCKVIDLDEHPNEILKYKEATYKSILIQVNDKILNIDFESYAKKQDEYLELDIENQIIGSLERLATRDNVIYYVDTHGEEFASEKLSHFRVLLGNMGYRFEEISLLEQELTHQTIFLFSPETDLAKEEIEALYEMVFRGNRIWIGFDLNKQEKQNQFLEFCDYLGFTIADDVLIDPVLDTGLIGRFFEHEITKSLSTTIKYITFPNAREMHYSENNILNFKNVVVSDEIVKNSINNFISNPLIISGDDGKSKILVSSGIDFLNNANLKDNKAFVLHLLDWLDPKVGLGIRKIKDQSTFVKTGKVQYSIAFTLMVILIPLGSYAAARWIKKRV